MVKLNLGQILLMVVWEKEYMKLGVGKVVDNMTRGSCIPIGSMKSSIGTAACIDSNKTNPAY